MDEIPGRRVVRGSGGDFFFLSSWAEAKTSATDCGNCVAMDPVRSGCWCAAAAAAKPRWVEAADASGGGAWRRARAASYGQRVRGGAGRPAILVVLWGCAMLLGVGGAGLEATLIAVDNSGYMINTDHRPSRLQSQYECVNLVCTVKTQIQKPINLTPKPITLPPKHINIEPEPTNPRRCAPSRPRTRKTLWVC